MTSNNRLINKIIFCACRIMVITRAFQARDVGSIPIRRFSIFNTNKILIIYIRKENYSSVLGASSPIDPTSSSLVKIIFFVAESGIGVSY